MIHWPVNFLQFLHPLWFRQLWTTADIKHQHLNWQNLNDVDQNNTLTKIATLITFLIAPLWGLIFTMSKVNGRWPPCDLILHHHIKIGSHHSSSLGQTLAGQGGNQPGWINNIFFQQEHKLHEWGKSRVGVQGYFLHMKKGLSRPAQSFEADPEQRQKGHH